MAQREYQTTDQSRGIGWVLGLAVLWALGWIGWAVWSGMQNADGFSVNMSFVVLALLPPGLAWLWAELVVQKRDLLGIITLQDAELEKLKARVKELEQADVTEPRDTELVRRVEQIAGAQKRTAETLAVFMSSRSTDPAPTDRPLRLENALPPENEPMLLPQAASRPGQPMTHEDFIRAANFPHSPEDRVGFAVMKLASQSDQVKPFINAAQDILTLLSQEGVYMDDFHPDPTRAEIWRNFAKGQRGRDIAALGGIRDRKVLEKISTRMREDSVFRDAVHHFLRKFDFAFTAFGETATDEELLLFAETRSARAFMLLGRIAGTFE